MCSSTSNMMEIISLPFNFTTLALLLSFIFYLVKIYRGSSKLPAKLPPTPTRLPVIGNLHHMVGGLPHHALTSLAQQLGPIMHVLLGEVSMVVISSPEAAKEALKVLDPAFAQRPQNIGTKIMWQDGFAFRPYDEQWRELRKLCIVEMLSAKNVKSFASIRKDEITRLLRSIRTSPAGESVNLTKMLYTYSSTITSRAAMGKVANDNEVFTNMVKEAIVSSAGFLLADFFPSWKLLHALNWNKYKLMRMRAKMDPILDGIIEEHKVKKSGEYGGEDVVDVMLRTQKNGGVQFPITNSHIKGIILDMFAAGTDTSATVVVWAMAELMRNPHAMKKVQLEIREALKKKDEWKESDLEGLPYLKMVIKETMRLHAPVPLIPRATKDECKIEGYLIPPDTKVMVNFWSIGRDPKYWHQPEAFLPERFENSSIDYLGNNFEFIPFGAGRRMCPGLNFGTSNTVIALSELLYHFDWKMPQGLSLSDMDLTEQVGITVSKKHDLFLVPIPYNPPS